jgi:hypothetical protein
MASLPRRRKPSVPLKSLSDIHRLQPILSTHRNFGPGFPGRASGFKSLMHFSYYLMIAALTLIGFEVIYALYQLATFVL